MQIANAGYIGARRADCNPGTMGLHSRLFDSVNPGHPQPLPRRMVSLYIANTDNDWFDFLSRQPDVSEVNFYQPGGKAFHAIEPGELFAFRLKSPRDKL